MILSRLLVFGFPLLMLSGCFAKSEIVPGNQMTNGSAITKTDAVAIMLPNDGSYGQTVYGGSGRLVAAKIKQATFRKVQNSEIVETAKQEEAIAYCKDRDIRFLIRPSILHWEDRTTNWSGIRDRIKLELVLVNPRDRSTLNSLMFNATSSWWTFVNNPPEDMLDESFEEAVQKLLFDSR